MNARFETATAAAVTTAFSTIYTSPPLDVGGKVSCEVENVTGGAAFTDFLVAIQSHPEGEWVTLADADDFAADFLKAGAGDATSPLPWVLFASTAIKTLATGDIAHIQFDVGRAYRFRLQGKCGTTTTAKARGNFEN